MYVCMYVYSYLVIIIIELEVNGVDVDIVVKYLVMPGTAGGRNNCSSGPRSDPGVAIRELPSDGNYWRAPILSLECIILEDL